MPFVLFRVFQDILECDCGAEDGCQGIDKHVTSTSSQLGPLWTFVNKRLSYKCSSHGVKLEFMIGDVGRLCPSHKGLSTI